jgi:hypothetical protein
MTPVCQRQASLPEPSFASFVDESVHIPTAKRLCIDPIGRTDIPSGAKAQLILRRLRHD